ncbi:MAG: hypothetical protein WCH05_00635 [Chlorobiaceae bacterium]
MAAEQSDIGGIYNYCDRWCERCPLTMRCLQFRIESAAAGSGHTPHQELDVFNADFWRETGEALLHATRLIRAFAERQGIELEELQRECGLAEGPESSHKSAREHPAAASALVYAGMAGEWFAMLELDDSKTIPAHEDAEEVIRRYQYFIYPKIVRALEGLFGEAASGVDPQGDACGSAHIALLTIDRSLAAWSILYGEYPALEDDTLAILLHLDRLRRSVESLFPAARAFRRPGFDLPYCSSLPKTLSP